jgi:hypothetical protein
MTEALSALSRATTESGAVAARPRQRLNPLAAIAGVPSIAIIGLAIWYLARPELLLVQGDAQSTRIDMDLIAGPKVGDRFTVNAG